MNNFERLKACEGEYEFADIVMGYVANNKSDIFMEDGSINSLEFLRWLQSNKNIFGETTDR